MKTEAITLGKNNALPINLCIQNTVKITKKCFLIINHNSLKENTF